MTEDMDRIRALLKEAGFERGLSQGDTCAHCGMTFTFDNVHTDAGWMETQISGLCETCYDSIVGTDEPEDTAAV